MMTNAATAENRTLRQVVRVAAEIAAPSGRLWIRLTTTADMPRFMLPLISLSLPDFEPVFGRYAADLKQEADCTGVN